MSYSRRYFKMKVSNYYNKQSNNTLVESSKGDVWFSYKTPIAFRTSETGVVVRQNDWSATTGKHLNSIDPDKSKRISGGDFMEQLEKAGLN